MKPLPALLLLATGVALGWGGSTFLASRARDGESDSTGTTDSDDRGGSALRASPGALSARQAGDSALARRLAAAFEGKEAAGLADAARRDDATSPRSARGWSALLTLYAMADQSGDFLRSVPDALRAGVTPEVVLDLVRLFPVAKRSDVLQRMLAAVTDVTWPAGEVADVFVEAGDPARAVAALATSLALEPHRALTERLIKIDPVRAAEILTRLAAEHGWDADRLDQIGDDFVKGGRPELAIAFFQAALLRDPLDRSALDRLASASPELGLAYARRLTQDHAANPKVWLSLGAVEWKAGNSQGAFDAYRQAASRALTTDALYGLLRSDPQRAYAAAMEFASPQSDDEALGVIACLALASDRPAESLDSLIKAHERDPSDYKWNGALVDLDPRRATEVLAASAQTYRGRRRDEVVGAYADALLETGSTRAAYDQYREAFELDPDDGSWQAGLARTDPTRALPILEERRRAVGDKPELLGALADAYAGSGRRDEARALYEQAAVSDGGMKWYGRMALVDPKAARTHLDDAITRDPKSDAAWGALGDYYKALGNAASARDAYAHAKDLDPSNLTWQARLRAARNRAP